jgi:acyl transferase domain-containing protein
MNRNPKQQGTDGAIAIVGMSGRFPGAGNVDQFWQNLLNGVESIAPIDDDEWAKAVGVHPAFLNDPSLVKARPKLEGVEMFDAGFFGFTPRAAQILDPQQRLFLECAWEALENAGYDTERFGGTVGVFAGVTPSTYLLNLLQHSREVSKVGWLDADLSNRCDSLATRVGYKLNLKGPCFTVQSYCSTSLVAIHQASQSLINHESDMAMAGGVTITVPQEAGYIYLEGSIVSPDGKTRTFDAKANGMVFGNGVGVVVLKRLEDAIADRDGIVAVILGSATNNDGSLKAGFTAPSVSGQTEVITEALSAAGVNPETVTYIEAHGTATPLGDPAEVNALTKAYRRWTDKKGYCAIGSVKTNVGHLDAAAGVTGVIKTALSMKHRQLPASLNYETPNPQIDFENSPFYVNTALTDWKPVGPRRAGVSAYGIGGTNAHVVLQEAPEAGASDPAVPWQVFVLSARTATALDRATENLRTHLTRNPQMNLADAAYTLQVGRRTFDHRRTIVCRDVPDAIAALGDTRRQESVQVDRRTPSVAFMFTGQGSQYVNMGLGLYRTERVFRNAVDDCARLLTPHLGYSLTAILYPEDGGEDAAADQLKQTSATQPALFAVEYALASLWKSWGLEPAALMGHSIGEYVAAHLAGVFSLEDALALVAARGQLMQAMPPGAMLSVQASEDEAKGLLTGQLCLAAANAPTSSVIAGPIAEIEALEQVLTARGTICRRLQTSHAFHSSLMDGALAPFRERFALVTLKRPSVRFVSNLTGTWITDDQATSPEYWVEHLRGAVRFSRGVKTLIDSDMILVEVGPGNTLAALARQHANPSKPTPIVASVRHPKDAQDDRQFLLAALGKLWLAGVTIDWMKVRAAECRQRVSLPTYPFERQRYWVEEAPEYREAIAIMRGYSMQRMDLANFFYQPSWRRVMPGDLLGDLSELPSNGRWLIFADECGVADRIVRFLKDRGQSVATVGIAKAGSGGSGATFVVNPSNADDYHTLVKALASRKILPTHILHLWSVTDEHDDRATIDRIDEAQARGFYSLMYLTQAFGREDVKHKIRMAVVSNQMQSVTGGDLMKPEKATVIGPCRVITQEFENIVCQAVDIDLPARDSARAATVARRLIGELLIEATDVIIAYRNAFRWVYTLEPTTMAPVHGDLPIRQRGTYLITGGMGGVGLVLAEFLADEYKANLVLTARSAPPARGEWEGWLRQHPADDPISVRIRQAQALEARGAKVLVVAADAASLPDMQAAVQAAKTAFGPVHGVIHAAGIAGAGILQMKQAEAAARVLAPKVMGTLILETVFKDDPLDFVVLCSSTAALIGGFGQVDYAAANAFLDAFAQHAEAHGGPRTVSINWDMWKDVGMGVTTAVSGLMKKHREISLKLGITNAEGVEAFKRILNRGVSQAVVLPLDVTPRLVRMRTRRRKQDEDVPIDTATADVASAQPQQVANASGNDLERTIAGVWNEVLGRRPNANDNFFELGGDSMTAIQVTALLKARLGRDVPIVKFYEAPTVALLAKALDTEKAPAVLQGVERRAETRLESMQRRRRVRGEQPILENA